MNGFLIIAIAAIVLLFVLRSAKRKAIRILLVVVAALALITYGTTHFLPMLYESMAG